jgi:hypothetical protein
MASSLRLGVRFVGGLALLVGCSPGVQTSGGNDSGGNGSGNGSGDGASSGQFIETGGGGANGDCITCSADLHDIIDCNGNLIQTCPDDKACSPDGTCIDPCASAGINKSTIGCDFYSVTPAVLAESRGSCFAAMIANTWTTPITVSAEYGGQSINAAQFTYVPSGQGAGLTYAPLTNGQLQPGELGILFLSKYESGDIYQVDCPVPQALELDTHVNDGSQSYPGVSGLGNAFRITTTAPIVAYDVYPWGGAGSFVTSATLLIPTPAWGTNYVTADAWGPLYGNPWTQIVASEDATTVTMVPTANVVGGNGAPSGAANAPMTITLNRGQMVQFLQTERLIGSILEADKPIGVWGGSSCMNIPDSAVACDAAHQELLPVQTLGSEYVFVRYPSRGGDDQAPFTLVGMVDGTTFTVDPPLPIPPAINGGEWFSFFTDQPFVIRSQDADHPFYLAAHMTGSSTAPDGSGDPEFTNIVPPQQFLDSYLFATDPTYANTALVFTRQKDGAGQFHDVTLDCLGAVTGWQGVGSDGKYEVARFKMVSNFQPTGACNNGVHTASSPVPFGLSVWGYDLAASYGYPAGMSVKSINTVIVPPVPQ